MKSFTVGEVYFLICGMVDPIGWRMEVIHH
jgi:hypothetical protein